MIHNLAVLCQSLLAPTALFACLFLGGVRSRTGPMDDANVKISVV